MRAVRRHEQAEPSGGHGGHREHRGRTTRQTTGPACGELGSAACGELTTGSRAAELLPSVTSVSSVAGRSADRAFTLIEMIVVMAIIGILSSLLITGVMAARGRGKIARTQSLLVRLDLLTKQYEIDHGDFPPGSGGTASAEMLYQALTSRKWVGSQEFTRKEAADTDGNGSTEIIDAWKGPLSYYHNRSYSGPPRATTFRLISKGPDGVQGTDDDITNWD